MKVLMPENIDPKVLLYNAGDFENMYLSKGGRAKEIILNTSALDGFLTKIRQKFPDATSLTEISIKKIKEDFPGITDADITNHVDAINDFYQQLAAYEATKRLDELLSLQSGGKEAWDAYDSYKALNSCESWFLIRHNRMASGVNFAKDEALRYEKDKFGSGPGSQDQGDAFRHAILTTLIAKWGGRQYNSVNTAVDLAIQFTDLHEDCDPNLASDEDHEMDKHNNRVGAEYFRSVGFVKKVGCFIVCNRNVDGPADAEMATVLFARPRQKQTTVTAIRNVPMNTLVHIK